jgi:predicted nucleic acid-binding protein
VKSLDANLLVYAHNTGCAEHGPAFAVLTDLVQNPMEWVLADQTLFEFYRCVRHPLILAKPLSAPEAAARLKTLREQTGCRICQHTNANWPGVIARLEAASFPYRRTFDAVLVETLLGNGVKTFYTHNPKDFVGTGFQKVMDPITRQEF